MIDLLKILLLFELIIRALSFFSDDPCFIQLMLELSDLIAKLKVFLEDLWYFRKLSLIDLTLGVQLEPFSAEGVQGFLHAELNEEVSKKLIRSFDSAACNRSRIINNLKFLSLILEQIIVIHASK